jgi:hypothetical protein
VGPEYHIRHADEQILLFVTSQDFIKFWGEIFVFVVLIEISQGFKTFEFI